MTVPLRLPRLALAAAVCVGGLWGCANRERPAPRLPEVVRAHPGSAPAPPAPDAEQNDDPAAPVEAMVGQIAGQPIYAHHVLDGMEEQLANLGRRLPATTFRQQALALIFEQVRGLVQDALIQDEASRSLDERQRAGLDLFVASRREELLRRYGQGSLALAERRLLEQTGQTLQERLRDIRTQILISSYLDQNLRPLINVTRRDIERFYRDNYETFNPPTYREILLVYAADEAAAAGIVEQLEAGTPFAEVAGSEANAYPGKATPLSVESDDAMFGPAVDPTVQTLEEGQWGGPMLNRGRQWFVYMAKLEKAEGRTLFEAQVDIERALRTRQERQLQIELGEKLRRSASFTDERRMAEAVLDIAVARYAAP